WAKPSTSSATWRRGCASTSTSDTPRSRSKAATRAARSPTARARTTTRTSTTTRWSAEGTRRQRLLALQDPPRQGNSGGVRGVHALVSEPARAQRPRLRVGGVRGVEDDAQVESGAGHVDALAQRIAIRLRDFVARVEIRTGLHLDHCVAALVVEVEVVAVLQERSPHRDRALVVQG